MGARTYNAVHSYSLPLGLLLVGTTLAGLSPLALIWLAHISFDRALGSVSDIRPGLVKRTLDASAATDQSSALYDHAVRSSQPPTRQWIRAGMWSTVALLLPLAAAHALLPWYTRRGTSKDEQDSSLPGDDLVPDPQTGYTMAITIHAAPSAIWPWLIQMGQGRGGFYTHEWVENLLGANIRNADRILSAWQQLEVGEQVRLTPDPYFGQPGQFMTVAEIQPERALVFRQTLPNGSPASWAFLLLPDEKGTTRVLMRRRGGDPTIFDRVMAPGYAFMDRGMLNGLRRRVEGRPLRDAGRDHS